MKPLYREKQKFNQPWLWLLLLATFGIALYAGWTEYAATGSWVPLIVSTLAGMLGPILLATFELRTTITRDGIDVKLWPLGSRRIFRDEILEARVREYSPLKEYGGWGIRTGSQGMAYNVSGNQGLQLRLKNGKRILIGTQRPEEMEAFMQAYLDDGTDLETLELKTLERKKLEDRLFRK